MFTPIIYVIILRYQLCTLLCAALYFVKKILKAFFVYTISHKAFLSCHKTLVEKLLQRSFCYQTLYITNVCRVISCITKVALLNNFRTESVLPAHDSTIYVSRRGKRDLKSEKRKLSLA